MRVGITLECVECKERNYRTEKNRRNDPDRLELKKFCRRCEPTPPSGNSLGSDLPATGRHEDVG